MEYKLTSKEYSEGLKQNKLLGLKCQQCGAVTAPPRMVCRKCASTELEVMELSGKGTLKTFTTVFVAAEGREDELPYIIVMAELEEGPWIMGNLNHDPEKTDMNIIGRQLKMTSGVFGGDKYSAGEMARPVFCLAD